MLVVEIDHVDAQPFQGGIGNFLYMLWPAVDAGDGRGPVGSGRR